MTSHDDWLCTGSSYLCGGILYTFLVSSSLCQLLDTIAYKPDGPIVQGSTIISNHRLGTSFEYTLYDISSEYPVDTYYRYVTCTIYVNVGVRYQTASSDRCYVNQYLDNENKICGYFSYPMPNLTTPLTHGTTYFELEKMETR